MAYLWKPASESSYNRGGLTVLTDGPVSLRDKNTGQIIETANNTGPSNGYGATNRFSKPGSFYRNVEVVDANGNVIDSVADDGGNRREAQGAPGAGNPITSQADANSFVANPAFVDPGMISFQPITATSIQNREISPTDILDIARQSIPYAREAYQSSLQLIKDIYPDIAAFSKEQISGANKFNQQQLDDSYANFPQILEGVRDNFERAKVFKAGGIPDTVLNRALDTGIRSRASDLSRYSGIGARSAFAGKTNQLLSAEESLKLMDKGQALETQAMAQAERMIAKPQRFEAKPEEYIENIRKESTITAKELVDEQEANRELNVKIDQYNATNEQEANKFNSEGLFQASVSQAELALKNAQAAQMAEQLGKDYYLQSLNREYIRQLELEDRAYYEDLFKSQQNNIRDQEDVGNLMGVLGLFGKGGIFGSGGALGGDNGIFGDGGFLGSGGTGGSILSQLGSFLGISSDDGGVTAINDSDYGSSDFVDNLGGAIGQNSDGSYIYGDDSGINIDVNVGSGGLGSYSDPIGQNSDGSFIYE
jgi:hypothetical protein